jgi:hypothetical protein
MRIRRLSTGVSTGAPTGVSIGASADVSIGGDGIVVPSEGGGDVGVDAAGCEASGVVTAVAAFDTLDTLDTAAADFAAARRCAFFCLFDKGGASLAAPSFTVAS